VKKKNIAVVFDLDDTLYKERDYKASGISFVCSQIEFIYGKNIEKQILKADRDNKQIWQQACKILKIPLSTAEQFKWLYRLHNPNIKLSKNASKTIKLLSNRLFQIAIFTEGRSYTQRVKLKKLKIDDLKFYISDELKYKKKELNSFKKIMQQLPASKYYYIGDNPKKDFYIPNKLGWETIGIKDKNNIHQQDPKNLSKNHFPKIWVRKIQDILNFIS